MLPRMKKSSSDHQLDPRKLKFNATGCVEVMHTLTSCEFVFSYKRKKANQVNNFGDDLPFVNFSLAYRCSSGALGCKFASVLCIP